MEDYLEAIYHLENERRIARVRDIAQRLGVKMSSVSSALRSLSARGFIEYDPHQYITLTERGIEKAKEIVRKHEAIKRFLVNILKVREDAAEDNACRLEHHLDPDVVERLVGFLEFFDLCPVDQTRWVEGHTDGCSDCLACLEAAKRKVRNRERAQQAAMEEGMTLAEAVEDSVMMITAIKGSAKLRNQMAEHGLEKGGVIIVEERDPAEGSLQVNVKGYHVSIPDVDLDKVFVKPM